MLKGYYKKRNFQKTPEPKGGKAILKKSKKAVFVIQEHQARNLHWDLRLEINGVLKSWAIPKGLPLKSKDKRLAVQTEDHPLEYQDFAGKIPKGEYGAGQVKIWDKGIFRLISREKDLIDFRLEGKRIKANFILLRPKKFPQNNWLIIKK